MPTNTPKSRIPYSTHSAEYNSQLRAAQPLLGTPSLLVSLEKLQYRAIEIIQNEWLGQHGVGSVRLEVLHVLAAGVAREADDQPGVALFADQPVRKR